VNRTKILVVEDDESLRNLLLDALGIAGFDVVAYPSVESVVNKITAIKADLIVSDINLPGLSGFDLLKTLRKSGNQIPFIALTARNERLDVTEGLREGADDYITKPFGLEELVLRIKAVLRRAGKSTENQFYNLGNVVLDYERHTVTSNGDEIEISPTEFTLLQVLMENQDKVVRKQVLMREVWGFDFETNTSVLDTYISYLRKKLPEDSGVQIKTVRGVGFKIEAQS
jgi:two-component system OmpR family response regulator